MSRRRGKREKDILFTFLGIGAGLAIMAGWVVLGIILAVLAFIVRPPDEYWRGHS